MITYEPLRSLLQQRGIKRNVDLIKLTGLTKPTVGKLMTDKVVSLDVLDKLCESLGVELHDIARWKQGGGDES